MILNDEQLERKLKLYEERVGTFLHKKTQVPDDRMEEFILLLKLHDPIINRYILNMSEITRLTHPNRIVRNWSK